MAAYGTQRTNQQNKQQNTTNQQSVRVHRVRRRWHQSNNRLRHVDALVTMFFSLKGRISHKITVNP